MLDVCKKGRKNGPVILKLAGEHTQPTTRLKIGSRGAGGGRADEGDE